MGTPKPPAEFTGQSSFSGTEGADRARQAALLGNDNGGYSPQAGWFARRGEDLQSGMQTARDWANWGLDKLTGSDTAAGRFANGAGRSVVDAVTGIGDLAGGGMRVANDPEFRGRVGDAITNVVSDPGAAAGRVWDATKDAFQKDPAGASGYALGTVATLFAGGAGAASKVGQGGRLAEGAVQAERLAAGGVAATEAATDAGGAAKLAQRTIPLGPQTATGARAMDVARTFYRNAGFSDADIAGHLKGIDFTKPVSVVDLPPGTVLAQARVPGRGVGNYFSDFGTPSRDLGIWHQGTSRDFPGQLMNREVERFQTQGRMRVLQSTAADTIDRWSVGRPLRVDGGGTQYFIPPTAKGQLRPLAR